MVGLFDLRMTCVINYLGTYPLKKSNLLVILFSILNSLCFAVCLPSYFLINWCGIIWVSSISIIQAF